MITFLTPLQRRLGAAGLSAVAAYYAVLSVLPAGDWVAVRLLGTSRPAREVAATDMAQRPAVVRP